MNRFVRVLLITLSFALSALAFAGGGGWRLYEDAQFGYSMLVPEGAQLATRQWPGGWGGLHVEYQGVQVLGIAKLGEQASFEDIERFGVELTGIPDHAWTAIDAGSGDGWIAYRTVEAQVGESLIFGGYGVGPRGSYLILLETTPADFVAHRADYQTWYESVRLH